MCHGAHCGEGPVLASLSCERAEFLGRGTRPVSLERVTGRPGHWVTLWPSRPFPKSLPNPVVDSGGRTRTGHATLPKGPYGESYQTSTFSAASNAAGSYWP